MTISNMLSIIIPVYNEKKTIRIIINKILKIKNLKKQIIIVDDGSTDGSTKELKKISNKKIDKIIYCKTNFGKGHAIRLAQPHIKGEFVIIQDADLEYDPRDFKKIMKVLNEKNQVVYGSRVLNTNRYKYNNFTSNLRVFANHILTLLSNLLNNQNLTDAHTCYKAFNSKIFKKIELLENGFSFCPEITTKISKLKINITEIKVFYNGRSFKDNPDLLN